MTKKTSCFDYNACKKSKTYSQLQVLARSLSEFDPLTMETPQERKAFWINLYNALIMHLVIVEDVGKSILEVKEFFTRYQYQLSDLSLTLDQIEHGILRGNRPNYLKFFRPFKKRSTYMKHVLEADPRIHMALFCASMSCAALTAYTPATVDQQLDQTVSKTLKKLVYIENNKIFLPKCFLWYKQDFGGKKRQSGVCCQVSSEPSYCQIY